LTSKAERGEEEEEEERINGNKKTKDSFYFY
jgi:hypothetical protein